ncbi:MAG: lytic transglycosylase domain-containing protein [Nocardioidaceae bacterium]|nr:lytic transglycosylase domain-containing protein [Nocardioidaceae bacterium]
MVLGAVGSLLLADGPGPRDVTPAPPPPKPVSASVPTAAVPMAGRSRWRVWPGHPNRKIYLHRVRRGDTATGLAVRFHAWTAELRSLNHLGRHANLYTGELVRIPVVLSAWRRDHPRHRAHHSRPHRSKAPVHRSRSRHPWRHADASRAAVRRTIVRTARRNGLHPHLLLAISWQESGWQQRRISSAGAVGAMQVMPGTGRWISTYAGRPLNLYGLHDNVTAGVLVVKVLKQMTSGGRVIGSYYQGLGSIREHGMYRSTKHYVRNVRYLRRAIRHGWDPS